MHRKDLRRRSACPTIQCLGIIDRNLLRPAVAELLGKNSRARGAYDFDTASCYSMNRIVIGYR